MENREIKFRGLRADGKGWVYGFPEYCPKSRAIRSFTAILENGSVGGVGVRSESVGQFTGLTDKNGNEIFEGDHLELCEDGFYYGDGPVSFKNGAFYVNDMILPDISSEELLPEITGNIHQNKELTQ